MNLITTFVISLADGQNYEPDSLTSFQNSIDRYLRENSCGKYWAFTKHREVLKAKRKQLNGKGK